ncbi:terminase gpP N-terminus-related DNA-binding protein [Flavobacterium sp. LB2P6]|uniref:terminase gpP N-terminus-related DNA-binding protein n=1 Tax=Flavobacterium sp. LB2P6 TaxID=3401714 RepID=UPI003AAA4CA3
MALKKLQEREYAKSLYISGGITQKEIASRVGVTEKTLANWIKAGKWEVLKKSLLTTKQNQLSELYDQLSNTTSEIKNRKVIYDVPSFLHKPIKLKNSLGDEYLEFPKFNETDYPILVGNVATSKDADAILKITTSIKRLETETSIGDTVEVARNFIEFVRPQDLELAKTITNLFDVFITAKMK